MGEEHTGEVRGMEERREGDCSWDLICEFGGMTYCRFSKGNVEGTDDQNGQAIAVIIKREKDQRG